MNALKEFWQQETMKRLPENELFYCQHLLTAEDINVLISSFDVKEATGAGLVNYLQNYALADEENGEARTYLVRDKITNELVAYFSIKAGMVSINEKKLFLSREFDSVPGIELANFAVNNSYKLSHKEHTGIGKIVFYYFILPIVEGISENLGVQLLYIFALPYKRLMDYYKSMNFVRLSVVEEYFVHRRIKPRYDKNCVFMCQRIRLKT